MRDEKKWKIEVTIFEFLRQNNLGFFMSAADLIYVCGHLGGGKVVIASLTSR